MPTPKVVLYLAFLLLFDVLLVSYIHVFKESLVLFDKGTVIYLSDDEVMIIFCSK